MLEFYDGSFGKHIRNQAPAVLRFKVIRLREERLGHVKGPVIFPVLVPLVLSVVDLVVRRRSRKVQLCFPVVSIRTCPTLISVRMFTSFGAIRIMSPAFRSKGSTTRSEDGHVVKHVNDRTIFFM